MNGLIWESHPGICLKRLFLERFFLKKTILRKNMMKRGAVENEVVEESWTLKSKLASAQELLPKKRSFSSKLRIFKVKLKNRHGINQSHVHWSTSFRFYFYRTFILQVAIKPVRFCTATWMIWWTVMNLQWFRRQHYIIGHIFMLMTIFHVDDWDG